MKINIKNIMLKIQYFALSFLYVTPIIISTWPQLRNAYIVVYGLRIGVSVCIIVLNVIRHKKFTCSIWAPFCGLGIWVLLANLINGKLGLSFLAEFIMMFAYLIVIENAFNNNKYKELLAGMTVYCIIVAILNIISQLYYGIEGMYHDWESSWQAYYICGNPNSFVFFYLFAIGIVMMYAKVNRRFRDGSYIFHLIVLYSLYISNKTVGSSTGLVVLGVLLIIRIFSIDIVKCFVSKHYKIMMVLLFTLATWLIVFDGWKSKWLLDLLDQYLNENISFVERGTIWKNAVQNIVVAPIFGYGTGAVQISQDMEGISRSAHNNYLQLTIFGGVPALILYFILIFNSLKIRVDKHKQKYFYDAMVVIAFFLLAYMFEQNPFYIGFYVMLMISWKFQSIKLSTGKTEIKYVTR